MLEGSILQKLQEAHRKKKQPLNFGVYYKNTLIALCHALEDFILESEQLPLMIAAFQQGKWYLQEAERYAEIADKASCITIMAVPDAGFANHDSSQKDNVKLVELTPTDAVAQEWHLMILSSQYTAMVLCQELSEEDYGVQGRPEEDLERKFYGFWTFEPELVRETVELTISHIKNYNPELAAKLQTHVEQISTNWSQEPREDIGAVLSSVVSYLETSHRNLLEQHEDMLASELDDNLASNKMQAFLRMAQLIDIADATNPQAATEVSALAEAMGQLLDLPSWQIKRLRLAGLLHRLPPLQGAKLTPLKSQAQQAAVSQSNSLAKASVLRIMPQLQAIAQIITHQTECWEGSGTPSGLSYDAIPLESRILKLIIKFQESLKTHPLAEAFQICQNQAGKAFDPKLVEALALLVMGMQQGMNIEVNQPKIAAGIWLLDENIEKQLIEGKQR